MNKQQEIVRLWQELSHLAQLGVFDDSVHCVTHYRPSKPMRYRDYTKIVYVLFKSDGTKKMRHEHVSIKHEMETWAKWHRTVRYRAIKRQLNALDES